MGQTSIVNWTRLSNLLDKRIQLVGQINPTYWTNVSNIISIIGMNNDLL